MEVAMPVAGTGAAAAASAVTGTGAANGSSSVSGTVTTMDSYEDMFKEITRKLYGEDGLPDLASGDKLTGVTTSAERGLTGIDYDVEAPVFKPEEHITAFGLAALMQNGFPPAGILNPTFQQPRSTSVVEDKWISNDDYLQWTQSKIASYNPSQKLFRCADCDCVGFLARVAEHWLGTHANLRVFQCPQCPYASAWARCVRMHLARQHNVNSEETVDTFLKENPVFHEITRYLQKLKGKFEPNCTKVQSNHLSGPEHFPSNGHTSGVPNRVSGTASAPSSSSSDTGPVESGGGSGAVTTGPLVGNCGTSASSAVKRYSCSYCPYATDRRDLFTRHENIHREEKPFQCYVCQKQFNRADHVKKHFLRMHREHPYDLNRIRRHPPKNASGMSYYHKYNNGTSTNPPPNDNVNNMQQNMQHPLTIPNGFCGMNRTDPGLPTGKPAVPPPTKQSSNMKTNSSGKASSKKKGEKRYSCCYCSWSGVDNWCLKRHLNTHLKPFVCGLCDYKAARSERLATHVLKVHNKRACGRCLFLADDQSQLAAHQQEHHPLEQRNNRSSNNVLRNNSFNSSNNPPNQPFGHGQGLSTVTSNLKPYELSAAAAILQHGSRLLPMASSIISNNDTKPWKPYTPKQHGAARLFNYMEASDGSEPECDTTATTDDMSRMSAAAAAAAAAAATATATATTTNQRNQSDFPEAGDVGNNHQGELDEEYEEEMELPLFICRECGCEFVDDTSLETHQYTHHRVEKITTSPANQKSNKCKGVKKNAAKTNTSHVDKVNADSKENVNPKAQYCCTICKLNFTSQVSIMTHMRSHITLHYEGREDPQKKQVVRNNQRKCELGMGESTFCFQDGPSLNGTCKRSRKQSQPRKVVPPLCENPAEITVKKRPSGKHRKWASGSSKNANAVTRLRDKYMTRLLNRRGVTCNMCKRRKPIHQFQTKASLAFHCFWRHINNKPFECEHCGLKFRHRYQVVLHASKEHVNKQAGQTTEPSPNPTTNTDKQIVPKLLNKEPIHRNVAVPIPENPQPTDAILTTHVPEDSTSTISVEKLTMHPYMEQPHAPMLHPNMPANNHIPIVIPTFPPS